MRTTTRPLTVDDAALLERATLDNVNWREERFTLEDVRLRPELAHYTRLVPARGDFGVVLELDGRPAGLAWAVLLPRDDPGYGYVDEHTPELSLWVRSEHRGDGLGRRLLRSLLEEAARRRLAAVTLSVEERNTVARHLYEQEGFTPVAGREANGVMVWLLPARRRRASRGT